MSYYSSQLSVIIENMRAERAAIQREIMADFNKLNSAINNLAKVLGGEQIKEPAYDYEITEFSLISTGEIDSVDEIHTDDDINADLDVSDTETEEAYINDDPNISINLDDIKDDISRQVNDTGGHGRSPFLLRGQIPSDFVQTDIADDKNTERQGRSPFALISHAESIVKNLPRYVSRSMIHGKWNEIFSQGTTYFLLYFWSKIQYMKEHIKPIYNKKFRFKFWTIYLKQPRRKRKG
ncbi:uncharacterized protein LOC126685715 [Mercurialis annua]|uniref:uncharacterized protein LOC126685715 n=1 Tax=Mercurialis annua TaxID=3986 RepID=UPI00215E0ECD|nr:uncharacterized protein LOC126685715 [Mercurialis annua]